MSLTFKEAASLLGVSRSGVNKTLVRFVRKDTDGGTRGTTWNEQDIRDLLEARRLEKLARAILTRLKRQKKP